MGGGISLGEVMGVRLRVSGLWLPAFALVLGALATKRVPQAQPGASAATYLGLGIAGALLLFLSVGAHELVHVLYAEYRGFDATRDTLYPFGGVSDLDDELRSPSQEFEPSWWWVRSPISSSPGLPRCCRAPSWGRSKLAVALFGYLNRVNVILGLLNLLPAYPLDGGRFLRAVFWNNTGDAAKANRWSLFVAQLIAYALMLWGIAQFFLAGQDAAGTAICLVCIGFFVLVAARASIRRAMVDALYADATVRELMRPAPRHIAASATLQQLMDHHRLAGDGAVPVLEAGRFVGLVTLADVRSIAHAPWATTPVSAVMTPRDKLVVAAPQQLARDVMPKVATRDVRQAPVLRGDQLVGMLGRDALLAYLEQRGAAPKEAEQPVATPVGPAG